MISLAAVIAEKILDRKGRTISALITDGLRYLALFICLFKILGYFGVDIRTMLASVGLVGLAISLAARDMLSDVIAGITILATGMYQVGDIIEISGFQGEVVNIGIRRTEVLGSGGNVKSYRNSQIDDIVNYSRMNSRYMMLVTIPNTYPVEEIEKLLNRELPDVGRKYKKILSGPRYSGIDSFTSEATTYIITTECSREDYSDVVRTVNRELRLILAGNNIDMAPENLSC